MFVLLGYLVALTVLLGSGYFGLEWLASPDDVSTHRSVYKLSKNAPVPPKKPAVHFPDPKGADVGKNDRSLGVVSGAGYEAEDSAVGVA
jgi:hypothetical protein